MLRPTRRPVRSPSRSDKVPFSPHAVERLEPRALLAAVAWDGGGGDGDWHNPLNWEGDVLPGVDDDVTIASGITPEVFVNEGHSAAIKSLDVNAAITIAGVLDVSDATIVGDVALTVAATGWVMTADLVLEGGDGEVVNEGEWTVGGESSIGRVITSAGTLVFADDSLATLASPGGIDTSGVVRFGSGAAVIGVGEGVHLRLVTGSPTTEVLVVEFGAGSELTDVNMEALGEPGPAAAEFLFDEEGVSMQGGSLDVLSVRVGGTLVASDARVRVRDRAELSGTLELTGCDIIFSGELTRGSSVITMTDSSLEFSGGMVENAVIENSQITIIDSGVLADCVVRGSTFEGTGGISVFDLVQFEACSLLDGLDVGVASESAIVFAGTGDHLITGKVIASEDGQRSPTASIVWKGGRIILDGAESGLIAWGVRARIAFDLDGGAGEITGTGVVRVTYNADLSVSEADITIGARFDNESDVEITDAQLRLTGPVDQIVTVPAASRPETPWGFGLAASTRLTRGTWAISGEQSLLSFGRRIDWNSARITINGGAIPDFGHKAIGGQLHTDRRIVVSGVEGGLLGTGYSTRIQNAGTLSLSGARLLGDIVNSAEGLCFTGFRAVVRGDVTNLGTLRITGSPAENTGLRIARSFTQENEGRLHLTAIRQGQRYGEPTLRIGGGMELGGLLRIDATSLGGNPPAWSVLLGQAKGGRVGEFDRVVVVLQPLDAEFSYTARGFRIDAN